MDISHSPAFMPVCDRLKSVFAPPTSAPMPVDLNRLLEALDEAYAKGDLFCQAQAAQVRLNQAL